MLRYLQAERRHKIQQPRFLVPCTPMQRRPDMLTDEAEARQERRMHTRDAIISRLMDKLDEKEDEFGKMELDLAKLVVVTEDASGNARVRRQS